MAKVFFCIMHGVSGAEVPYKFHDEIDLEIKNKILWGVRLDTLPDAEKWLAMSCSELMEEYVRFRSLGVLPASNIAASDYFTRM